MRRKILQPALTTMLSLALAARLAAAAGEDPRSPEEIVAAFHKALSSGDRAAVTDLLAPDVVIFESGGTEASRDEYASHHLGADMELAKATKRETLDRRSGEAGDAA